MRNRVTVPFMGAQRNTQVTARRGAWRTPKRPDHRYEYDEWLVTAL